MIRGRLAGVARGWGHGHGPRALLACVPGELHDIGLLAFGIVLHRPATLALQRLACPEQLSMARERN